MLNTIKNSLNKPFISYEEYFKDYVMYVQDANILREVSFAIKHNNLTPISVDKLVDTMHKELKGDK